VLFKYGVVKEDGRMEGEVYSLVYYMESCHG